jgi:hypothetical protein
MALDPSAWQAITSLRPGMHFAQWVEAQAQWIVARHEEGTPDDVRTVALHEDAEAVVLRAVLDDAGERVESVTFDGDMPTGTAIDGVRFNADRDDLRALAGPFTVEISDEARMLKKRSGLDRLLARRDEHTTFVMCFGRRALASLSIVSDATFYPFAYRPDALFEDLNFKLNVIECLLRDKHIALPPKPEITGIDDEDEAYDAALDARLSFWYAYPLSAAQLAQVTHLEIDVKHSIFTDIDPDFAANSEDFDVLSLGGIEHLPNLEKLTLTGMTVNTSLAPLAGHPKLREVRLSAAHFEDFDALEKLPRLTSLSGAFKHRPDTDQGIVSRLGLRGVKVRELGRK